jgi:hypothetical protein
MGCSGVTEQKRQRCVRPQPDFAAGETRPLMTSSRVNRGFVLRDEAENYFVPGASRTRLEWQFCCFQDDRDRRTRRAVSRQRKHAAQKMMKLLQVFEAEAHADQQLRIVLYESFW